MIPFRGYLLAVCDSTIQARLPKYCGDLGLDANKDLLEYLGLCEDQVVSYSEFDTKAVCEVVSEQVLFDLAPNFDALKRIKVERRCDGIIVEL
ncbi:hypothetical protein O9929_23185 [Vibrio lentus]|nr:hypothetical protein [Vibrio lentus]